jgi:hypothetical protein
MVQRIGAREDTTDKDKSHTGKMLRTPQRKRNTKNVRRNNEDQYTDYDHHCVVHKTLPQSKLQTVTKDYRIPPHEDIEEDFDRVLYTNPGLKRRANTSPVRRENVRKIFSKRKTDKQQWREPKHDSTTDSDSQDKQVYTRYGTFPRFRAGRARTGKQPIRSRETTPVRYEEYRKTYKFVITTDEPTTLLGESTRRVHAKIPEGTTITADSQQNRGRGERTYQTDKATQTLHPWLSTFERRFDTLSM